MRQAVRGARPNLTLWSERGAWAGGSASYRLLGRIFLFLDVCFCLGYCVFSPLFRVCRAIPRAADAGGPPVGGARRQQGKTTSNYAHRPGHPPPPPCGDYDGGGSGGGGGGRWRRRVAVAVAGDRHSHPPTHAFLEGGAFREGGAFLFVGACVPRLTLRGVGVEAGGVVATAAPPWGASARHNPRRPPGRDENKRGSARGAVAHSEAARPEGGRSEVALWRRRAPHARLFFFCARPTPLRSGRSVFLLFFCTQQHTPAPPLARSPATPPPPP